MKKIKIEGLRLGDNVLITAYNPPITGKIVDMYEVPSTMVADDTLKKIYPKDVPIVEVVLDENGKLRSFVKDVVKKA